MLPAPCERCSSARIWASRSGKSKALEEAVVDAGVEAGDTSTPSYFFGLMAGVATPERAASTPSTMAQA